jgi:hypothetical protein
MVTMEIINIGVADCDPSIISRVVGSGEVVPHPASLGGSSEVMERGLRTGWGVPPKKLDSS